MWNFNNGSQLKEFTHNEPHMEFSSLAFIHDSHKQSNQVGTLSTALWSFVFLVLFLLVVLLAASCAQVGLKAD